MYQKSYRVNFVIFCSSILFVIILLVLFNAASTTEFKSYQKFKMRLNKDSIKVLREGIDRNIGYSIKSPKSEIVRSTFFKARICNAND